MREGTDGMSGEERGKKHEGLGEGKKATIRKALLTATQRTVHVISLSEEPAQTRTVKVVSVSEEPAPPKTLHIISLSEEPAQTRAVNVVNVSEEPTPPRTVKVRIAKERISLPLERSHDRLPKGVSRERVTTKKVTNSSRNLRGLPPS